MMEILSDGGVEEVQLHSAHLGREALLLREVVVIWLLSVFFVFGLLLLGGQAVVDELGFCLLHLPLFLFL